MIRILAIALCLTAAGCGTVEGIGRDISDSSRTVRGWF
ncbi:MAG: entericidin EcnA/B family protein [Pseudomonadota bacterium]